MSMAPVVIPPKKIYDYFSGKESFGKAIRELVEYEKRAKLIRDVEQKTRERFNPSLIPLGTGSPKFELARVLYGEGRGESKEFLHAIADTVLTRAEIAGLDEDGLVSVIFDNWRFKNGRTIYQYSCFNAKNPNHKFVINISPDNTWEKCYQVAGDSLNGKGRHRLTHYWTEPYAKMPDWALRKEPAITFSHKTKEGTATTRFYRLFNNPGEYKPREILSLEA